MDETTSLIYFGCNIAKDLETNLPNLANQPSILFYKCDEIITIFSNAKERLLKYGEMILGDQSNIASKQHMGARMQEYAMENSLNAQVLGERSALEVHGLAECKMEGIDQQEELRLETMVNFRESGRGDLEGSAARWRGHGRQLQAMETSDCSRVLSSQRQRRRRDDADKRTIRVPAPRMGNTEIPLDDGHTWRKYGQKDILGSNFPRAYYRCTHQKLFHCPAKKQVQRLDDDPYTFEVTYQGQHACHMYSTAPSSMHPSVPSTSSFPSSHWLSMDIKISDTKILDPNGTIGSLTSDIQMQRDLTSGSGPSTVEYGRDVDFQSVAESADLVFNSASSGNNSMELIFSSMEDHWEGAEKQY